MAAIVDRDWTQLVRVCCLDNWREVLAALVTYAGPDEFSTLCGRSINFSPPPPPLSLRMCVPSLDLLGERLEDEGEGRYRDNANLCYICSGNVDKFVECWLVGVAFSAYILFDSLPPSLPFPPSLSLPLSPSPSLKERDGERVSSECSGPAGSDGEGRSPEESCGEREKPTNYCH